MDSGVTAIRGKDWIFNALWSAAGDANAPECKIEIPITALFRDGKPFRCLHTDAGSGLVRRFAIGQRVPERIRGEVGLRGESFKEIRELRQSLVQFSEDNNYGSAQKFQEEPLICKVYYNDGETEDLSQRKFDALIRNDSWRFQVLFIQAFIPPTMVFEGQYTVEKKVRSLLRKNGSEATDNLTRALAKFAENAYKVSSVAILERASAKSMGGGSVSSAQSASAKSMGGGSVSSAQSVSSTGGRSTATSTVPYSLNSTDEIELKVQELRATFCTDTRNHLYFLCTEYVNIDVKHGKRKDIEDFLRKEKSSREATAAQAVLGEFSSLLQHARRRGLQPEDSYIHFDPQRNGFVDVDALIDGLSRLGIGVTYPVGEQLMQIIGGVGALFLNVQDFERFIREPPDIEAFQSFESSNIAGRTARSLPKSLPSSSSQVTKRGSLTKDGRYIPDELRPVAVTRRNQLPSLQSQIDVRNMDPDEDLGFDGSFASIEESQNKQWLPMPAAVPSANASVMSSASSAQLPLPVAEAHYHTGAPTGATGGASELPNWASQRQKRALKELKRAQSDWVKKQPVSAIAPTSGATDGESVASSVTRESRSSQGKRSPHRTNKVSPESRSKTAKAAPSVSKLNLSGIKQDMTRELMNNPDELLHVDHGLVMTYRVITGKGSNDDNKTKEESEVLRYRSILEVCEKNLEQFASTVSGESKSSSGDHQGPPTSSHPKAFPNANVAVDEISTQPMLDRWVSFTVVVVPDLFSTLDALQQQFEAILIKYPLARVVLVGVPGMPHTTWPEGWVLNADLHARSIVKLMSYLRKQGRISNLADEPVFFFGIGIGAHTLSRFVVQFLPALGWLEKRLKSVCFINGILKYNKPFRKICADLRKSLLTAGPFEVNELTVSLHFWDQYLAVNDRDESIKLFWSLRRELQATPSSLGVNEHSQLLQVVGPGAGAGLTGVLELLKSILMAPDDFDGAMVLTLDIPVIVVQSTEDVFVDPRNAAVYQREQLPPERTLVTEVADCLDTSAVFVCWLRAGHEVLQERNAYVLALVSNLAQMCGIHPTKDSAVDDEDEGSHNRDGGGDEEEVFDVLVLSEKRKRAKAEERRNREKLEYEAMLAKRTEREKELAEEEAKADAIQREVERVRSEQLVEEEKRLRFFEKEQEELRLQQESEWLEEEKERERAENELRRGRQAAEKEKRLKLAEERRKREMKAQLELEMAVVYEREREAQAVKNEQREMKQMTFEDKRSKFAADWVRSLEIHERSQALAKDKTKQLFQSRREEAIKNVEDSMAVERSKRIEERRQKAMELVKKIESEELVLASGGGPGVYDAPVFDEKSGRVDVNGVIMAAQVLMRDLMDCRQQTVEALKRQMLVESKYYIFKKQCDSLENDLQRLRRAIRLIEINPSIIGGSRADSEIEELKRSLGFKEESFQELKGVMVQREAQLSASNKRVQLMKIASRERDALMKDKIVEMLNMEAKLVERLQLLKMEKEHLIVEKDKMRLQEVIIQKRIDGINKELKRVSDHKGQYIDTDVWVEGVMQRTLLVDLKKHLNADASRNQAELLKIQATLEEFRLKLVDVSDRIGLTRRDGDKLGMAAKSFKKSYNKYSAVSVMEIMKSLADQHENAERVEDLRKSEQNVKQLQKQMATAIDEGDLVGKLRLKEAELRTSDERKFIGMDMVLHPEQYLHISILEAEQMQFDKDYHCDLSVTDLQRIERLPEHPNLALPFLHTPLEVNAHRLFNVFKRGKDEAYFRRMDFMSEGIVTAPAAGVQRTDSSVSTESSVNTYEERSVIVDAKDIQEAESVHDVLLKEARRDRVRAMGGGDNMTDDQRCWVKIDKILSPHVYDISELGTTDKDIHDRSVVMDLSTQVITLHNSLTDNKESILTKDKRVEKDPKKLAYKPKNEGDVYDRMRERYADGEVVFDDSWRCPFTKEQILAIRALGKEETSFSDPCMSMYDPQSDKQVIKVRELLDKYYVDDNESIMGHKRLKTMLEVSQQILTQNAALDKIEENERIERHILNGLTRSASEQSASSGADGGVVMATEIPEVINGREYRRIWGSWEQVHPASAGALSQEKPFVRSAFNASRDHPASFAIDEDAYNRELSKAAAMKEMYGLEMANGDPETAAKQRKEDGLTLLQSHAGKRLNEGDFDDVQNDPNSNWFICEDVKTLAMADPKRLRGKTALLTKQDRLTVFEVKDQTLASRQSRSHRFELPDRDDSRILDVMVSVIFQGSFSTKGYRLGRLAASLFRLPGSSNAASSNSSPLPIPVGYAPYALQTPNLPEALGRVVILHRPRARPMKPGGFQIVIGVASNTKYSIEVNCRYAATALPIIDDMVTKARQQQSRMPICIKELEDLNDSLRIAERKLLLCNKMVDEADTESKRCMKAMRIITTKLEQDDEEMIMLEEERKDFQRELAVFEIEYAQWARVFTSRCKEREDIKDGIQLMHKFQRERHKEKAVLKEELEVARRDLPSCIAALRGFYEASNVAASLNTVLQGAGAAMGLAAGSTGSGGGSAGVVEPVVTTPAEDIRRNMKREGFKNLSLEEQQWCMLDQVMNPHMYEWLREQEEQEDAERIARGKAPKVRKFNAAVEAFRITKAEIDNIMRTPYNMLSRRETAVRKLLTKFHDDPDVVKRKFAAAAYGFDPFLAERTRAKNRKGYTIEEQEWSSIDRILHPEIWKFYVNEGHGAYMDLRDKEAEKMPGFANNGGKGANNASNDSGVNRLDEDQQKTVSTLGRLLGKEESVVSDANSLKPSGNDNQALDISELVSNVHRKAVDSIGKAKSDIAWQCNSSVWPKERLLKVWRTPRHKLGSDDERKIYKLLNKYNGSYKYYMDNVQESMKRQAHGVKEGAHIKWAEAGKRVSIDPDLRCRDLMHEIDRATYTQAEWMTTDVLHGINNMFPTRVLRMHLEETLDIVLMDQIRERERSEKIRVDSDSSDSGSDSDLSLTELNIGGDEGEENDPAQAATIAQRVQKRARRREKRRLKLKQDSEKDELQKAKKKLIDLKKKSGEQLAEAILINELGPGGCVACRSNPCKWGSSVDVDACEERRKVLDRELERVKLDRNTAVFESDVCLSAMLGGNKIFKRMDLMDELQNELTELDRQIQLSNVDKEYHDAYATRSEYFEVKHLHGYSMMLWTNNARQALKARQQRLVAYAVAKEVVDDILDWMMEGWYFGERESTAPMLGTVPSVKHEDGGRMRPGQDQIKAVGAAIAKMKKRNAATKSGQLLDIQKRGPMHEKSKLIEEQAQLNLKELKVARDGNAFEHNLNETESTLKFGLFMLTLMYFRAMVYLRRDIRSFSGDSDAVGTQSKDKKGGGADKLLTNERLKMLSEESRAAARKAKIDAVLQRCRVGEQRKIEREAAERREAILRLQTVVKRQKQELASICHIQRLFRGHLGRKAATRWALKRAELGAMTAVMTAAATCLQRCFRGYSARLFTVKKRMEMAQFIALMRAQEAAADESVYWETHPWQRFKRGQKEWMDKNFRKEHQTQVLGGARLTEEEQARMLGKSLDEIEDENEKATGEDDYVEESDSDDDENKIKNDD